MGMPVAIDPDVPAGARAKPIRLQVELLTGEQSVRWLARLGGQTCVRVGDGFVVGGTGHWPAAWRARSSAIRSGDDRLLALENRRADVAWADHPLGAVMADIRKKFLVDVILDPSIMEKQDLITLAAPGARWIDVAAAVAKQTGASHAAEDGAVLFGRPEWIATVLGIDPSSARANRAPRPTTGAAVANRPHGGEPGGPGIVPPWWTSAVRVSAKERSWKNVFEPMMQVMGPSATWRFGETPRAGAEEHPIEADGPTGQILEGLRAMDRLAWRWQPAEGAPRMMEIQVRP
jgi:hypothetical protein